MLKYHVNKFHENESGVTRCSQAIFGPREASKHYQHAFIFLCWQFCSAGATPPPAPPCDLSSRPTTLKPNAQSCFSASHSTFTTPHSFWAAVHFLLWAVTGMSGAIPPPPFFWLFKQPHQRKAILIRRYWYSQWISEEQEKRVVF